MNLLWLLVVILVIFALLGTPHLGVWQHNYGYGPTGVVTLIVIILVVLLLMGKL